MQRVCQLAVLSILHQQLKWRLFYRCIFPLAYEKIISSNDVVAGDQLSPFDRCVYDAVVTIYVAGNSVFSTADIWHIISHNPKAQITAITRQRIVRSMFHIARFWIYIATDDSNNTFIGVTLEKITLLILNVKFTKIFKLLALADFSNSVF